jgi:hypothetical protein
MTVEGHLVAMPRASIDRLVDDPEASIDDLLAYTKGNGGRTRLLWTKDYGAVQRDEAVVLCATDPEDIRAIIELSYKLWGPNANQGSRTRPVPQ